MSSQRNENPLVFGRDQTVGIVAVEHEAGRDADHDTMHIVLADGDARTIKDVSFEPSIWVADASLLEDLPAEDIKELSGTGDFRYRLRCGNWAILDQRVKAFKKACGRSHSAPDAPYYFISDPVQQYLVASGQTFFKGMAFSGLKRLQVDIETYTEEGFEFSNAEREADRIIAIALADETGWTEVLSGEALDEKALLEQFVEIVRQRDPDVIEGHNLFKFDLPYIKTRAKRCKVKLALGRDGSTPRSRNSRMQIAERTLNYPRMDIFGRHVVDTFFLVQLYDVMHRALEGFGLKDAAIHFGVAAPDRTYIEGGDIARMFRDDPGTLMDYARDDILETRALSDILSPVYFAEAQILPFSYQNISVRGNAAKIEAMMVRAYEAADASLPRPGPARNFAGGYTDIFYEGVAENVHHCDIRSLYPSIMLTKKWGPDSDEQGVFLKLLDYLRDFRLTAKANRKTATDSEQQRYYEALDSAFKILINSFYGYLGFSQGRFNDFDCAEQVAAEGRRLIHGMIDWLKQNGAQPIELDTDGIYFVPPAYPNDTAREQFETGLQQSLPEGIEVEFDGQYKAMFSYKMKNYALLGEDDEMVIKGAALKSRGLEPFQRDFLRDLLRCKLERRDDDIAKLLHDYQQDLLQGRWPIQKIAKTERLQDNPSTYEAKIRKGGRNRNAAYELALKSDQKFQAGDQISYYVTGSKKSVTVYSSAKRVADWNPASRDENIPYYLAKLDSLYKKFAG